MRGRETFAAARSALLDKSASKASRIQRPSRSLRKTDNVGPARAVGQVRTEAESPSEKAYECMVSQEGLSVRGRFKRAAAR